MDVTTRKTRVALLSVASNTSLVVLKLIVGAVIGSVSVMSEAIHSGVDLIAALIATLAVRTSGAPADEEHPFGHGKVENISGTIEALLIFFAAAWIVYEAVHRLMKPQPIEAAGWGVAVMLLSALLNTLVSHWLFKVGKETDSVALEADAWHLRTDVYTSAGVMLGMAAIWSHERFFPTVNIHWIDPVAAICVAMLIVKAAWELTVKSTKGLLDVRLPADEVQWIKSYICSRQPQICGYHKLRTRKSGAERFVEFDMLVRPDMSVDESHAITDEATRAICEHFGGATVTIHVEPYDGERFSECPIAPPDDGQQRV
jgi:cation diffusion facilitator family transporter